MERPVPWHCLWYPSFVNHWLASWFPSVGTTLMTSRIWISPIPWMVLHAWMSSSSLGLTCIGNLSPVRHIMGILDQLPSIQYSAGCCQGLVPPLHQMSVLLALSHILCCRRVASRHATLRWSTQVILGAGIIWNITYWSFCLWWFWKLSSFRWWTLWSGFVSEGVPPNLVWQLSALSIMTLWTPKASQTWPWCSTGVKFYHWRPSLSRNCGIRWALKWRFAWEDSLANCHIMWLYDVTRRPQRFV